MPTFRIETLVAAAPDASFELSLSVDAHAASMLTSSERPIAGVTTGTMQLGDTVTWQARHFGIPFRMTSVIAEHDRPRRFVDEQVRGPFGRWWHEHTFTATPDGGTLLVDTVRYRAPLGPLGTLAERLVLDRYLRQLIRQRNAWLKAELESDR
ncbi:SRPBCC family protein [Terrabacter sp. GCM10028922]|uniref:SRPBCC family protein n=1 Tax=Terrabacter sp. GCM10028922 TaxID=3273428 RepID=UPI003617E16D